MPVTDLLCTNNHTDPSNTSEPCVEHKDIRNKPPKSPNELLTHISMEVNWYAYVSNSVLMA